MDRPAAATAEQIDRPLRRSSRKLGAARTSSDASRREAIGALGHFGVPADAERVWRALLDDPAIGRDELAARAAVTQPDLDDAVAVLLRAHLVRQSTDRLGITVVDPVLAIEAQIARHERKVARQAEELAELRSQLPELAIQYSRNRADEGSEPGFEVLMGLDDVRHQIYLAAERAKLETRSLDHAPGVAGLRHSRETDISTLGRGVRERSIFAATALTEPGVYKEIEVLHDLGHHVRTLPDVPTRLSIFDCDLVVLPIDADDLSVGAMFIRTKSLIETFIYMFDRLWAEADPLFGEASDLNMPSRRAARVLELMAIGTKDQGIARSLGVGVRTIRRDVAEIRTTLGVGSRTEIAAAAVRRGWL